MEHEFISLGGKKIHLELNKDDGDVTVDIDDGPDSVGSTDFIIQAQDLPKVIEWLTAARDHDPDATPASATCSGEKT